MPKLDKTGPEGKGPRTGRGMGDCSGCPFCGNQQITNAERKQILEEQKKLIEEELKTL